MQRRLFGVLASAALVLSACGTAAPSGSAAPPAGSASPAASTPASTEPSPSAVTGFTDDLLFSPAPYNPEAGKVGGTVVVSDWQTYSILNKYYTSSFKNSQVMAATWAGNWDISPDGKWIPELVTSVPNLSNKGIVMDASGAGFTITMQYKPGLTWSDGKPLTMADMKFTWEYIMDPKQVGLVSGTVGWDLIDKFDVSADGLTGTIHFKEGYAGYYGLLGDGPMPKHYMETFSPAEAADKSYPVGTPELANAPTSGPFKYGASSADTVELVRNDNWKGGSHTAYLDKIVFKFYTDAKDAMIAAFLAKEVDVATDLLQGDYASIQGVDPAWGQALIGPAWEYEHLDLNQQNEAFKDAKVREAVARAIDKDKLWDIVYPGVPKPVKACAPTPPGLYWRAENLTCADFDVEKAKALLTEAGYTDSNNDGTVDKGGKELTIQHCSTPAPFRVAGGDTIASMLKEVGIKVTPTYDAILFEAWSGTTPETQCNIYRGTYDTAEFAYVLTLDIFGDYYYSYHSSQVPTEENGGEGGNTMRLNDPTMDAALDELYKTVDPAKIFDIAQTLQKIYADSNFEVPLYYRASVRGLSNRLGNFVKNPSTASDMWNTEDWFVKE
jgi:peptide/nickel transport system substrate-binding protein